MIAFTHVIAHAFIGFMLVALVIAVSWGYPTRGAPPSGGSDDEREPE